MRYYRIRQDRHLRNRITFQDLEGCPNLVFDKGTIRDFKRSSVLYVQGDKNSQYPDLFESPVLLISEKLFDIIRYYDTEVEFRIAVLTDLKQKRQDVYRLMVPKVEDALSEQTIYFKNGFLDTPVLKRNLCPQRRIFYVTEGYTYQLIVTEDVLESILARNSIGILYEEIKTE